jgi:hypothetical protein
VTDETLDRIVTEVSADPETVGLLLIGSRSTGTATDDSDYDLIWVLTDDTYRARRETHEKQVGAVDMAISSVPRLGELTAEFPWLLYAFAASVVLHDRNGELAAWHEQAQQAEVDANEAYDGYLNGFVRSLGSWRKGDELGARLHAEDSLRYLAIALWGLESRHAPYYDVLSARFGDLDSQGWPAGYLRERFLEIARTADPRLQQELDARVEALMEARGHLAHREWGDKLTELQALEFEGE